MAAINQRIPNFLGGVSQQPDFIKFPGQLRTCHNAHPDVTFGLQKRPPGEYVGKLANAVDGGQWFDIIRDNDEKYLVQIRTDYLIWDNDHTYSVGDICHNDGGKIYVCDQAGLSAASGGPTGTGQNITDNNCRWDYSESLTEGVVRVWNLATGVEQGVVFCTNGPQNFGYLLGATDPLGKLTINDYTILANPQKTVREADGLNGTTARVTPSAITPNYGYLSIEEIGYDTEYVVALNNPNLTATTKYRAQALKVVKQGTTSSTFDDSNPEADHVGVEHFRGTSSDGVWEDVGFTVTVNATHYINSYTERDAGNDNKTFTPEYNTQYTASVVLTETGLDVGSNWANASKTITLNGLSWTVTITKASSFQSYDESDGAVVRTVKNVKEGVINLDYVLGNLRNKLILAYGNGGSSTVQDVGLTAEVIGNGIYFETVTPYNSISAKGGVTGKAIQAVTTVAQNISRLPGQCRDGYLVKVANTEDSSSDDYHVRFEVTTNLPAWDNSTAYTVGKRVVNDHRIYECDTNGTSHATSAGPTGTGANISDGTTQWDFVGNLVGAGIWEETVEPGITAGFAYETMPHALINYRNGNFAWTTLDPDATHQDLEDGSGSVAGRSMNPTTNGRVAPTAWEGTKVDNYWVDRKVGDTGTNPSPTFVSRKISKLFFVRNRLGVIAGEQVVISQPADYFNFFVGSAIAVSDADPIDLAASDLKPAFLNHVLPIQKGVVLFSEAAQFMLFTEAEVFGPSTAQIKKMASFNCSKVIAPVDTGTSIIFVEDNTSYAKVFEMVITTDNAPPKVVEQTRVVPEYVPNDINNICNSSSSGIVTLGKVGDSNLYSYKHYDQGNERKQSAWYSWGIKGTLVHQLYTGGNYFTVTKQGSEWIISRYELVVSSAADRSYTIGTGTVGSPTDYARRFEACLDNMIDKNQATEAYNSTTKQTTITYPYSVAGNTDLRLVDLADGYVRHPVSISGSTAVYDNVDLTSTNYASGYTYTMEAALPTYYYALDRGVYDIEADLRIQRYNFDLGVSGPMEFHLTSPQMADHVHYESGIIADLSNLNAVPSQLEKNISIPIYRKNHKFDMTVKIPAPFTATLISASWDGNFSTKRHVRR